MRSMDDQHRALLSMLGQSLFSAQRLAMPPMPAALRLPLFATGCPAGSGWHERLVVLLHFAGDVCRKDGLQPRGWATANDPSVCCGYGASKASGKSGGTQGKAFVPVHGRILPRKIKCAMRKINLAFPYAMRKFFACPTPHKPPSKTQSSSTQTALESQ